jgi:hypothetical protein
MTSEEEIKSSETEHVVNIRNKLADVTRFVQINLEIRQSNSGVIDLRPKRIYILKLKYLFYFRQSL